MQKYRILHCLEQIGSGGVEQRRLLLASALDPQRYEQHVVCTRAIGDLPRKIEKAGCRIHEVGDFRAILDRRPYKATLGIVQGFRPHIIHGAVYEGVAQAAVAGRLGRVPIIVGEETSDPQNRSWRGNLLYRLFAGLCHHMVGVSPAVIEYLEKVIRVPRSKLTLINNGVAEKPGATREELTVLRERFGLTEDAFVVGTVGRLFDGHKRVSDLIKAMPMIVAGCHNATLLIVGAGPDEMSLKNLAQAMGVAEQVRFAGYQANTQPFYQVMDVFTLASAHEAFGLVLVEAMFAELPVVATRVGGIPGVVNEGDTGYLVDPCRPKALANSILSLARDSKKRCSMGQKGRERALALFSAERYVRDVDALYQRLLSSRAMA